MITGREYCFTHHQHYTNLNTLNDLCINMVESQKDHISVPITHSTERLNEEKGDSSRSSSGSNSPEIWVPPAIRMVYSEQKDDVLRLTSTYHHS
jgi:hypothetical protein